MSIINEALKKAQTDLHLKKKKTPVTADDLAWTQRIEQEITTAVRPCDCAPISGEKKSKSGYWYALVLLEICSFCAIVWILFILQPQIFNSSARENAAPKSGTPSPQPPPVPAQSSPPSPLQTKTPSAKRNFPNNLVLNGTMVVDNQRVALINGEIYEVGDYINGKKIVDISLEKVDLLSGDDVISLSVRPKKSGI